MTFLDFLNEKKAQSAAEAILTEAFKSSDLDKAHELMIDLFNKKIGGKVAMDPQAWSTTVDGKNCKSYLFVHTSDNKEMDMFTLNYLVSGNSSEVYSIDFFGPKATNELMFGDGKTTSDLSIFTQGTSVAYFIPIICHVVSAQDYELNKTDATKIANKVFGEALTTRKFYLGAQTYNIIEGVSSEVNENAFHINLGHTYKFDEVNESYIWESELTDLRKQKGKDIAAAKDAGDNDLAKRLRKEYAEIVKAIQGGATDLKDINMSISKGSEVAIKLDTTTMDVEKEFTKKGVKDPKEAFKEMYGYLNLVTKGLQPGVIICGAPGIGKTYKVLRYVESKGYKNGENMHIIKGKCSTRSLWADLYDYREKGKLIIIDDADGLIGPKAPEECINILKAALDSTSSPEGRLVTYRVAGKLVDEDGIEIPKEFYYNGSLIILTNYSVGQLDTALRGRVFTQTLDFTNKQLLQVIEDLLPSIEPQKLSNTSKIKAITYLKELDAKGTNMVISIRSFVTCAGLYEMGARSNGEFTDEVIESMIAEQLRNQFQTSGKHF